LPDRSDLVRQENDVDSQTLIIILIVLLVLGFGGFYGRGRWY